MLGVEVSLGSRTYTIQIGALKDADLASAVAGMHPAPSRALVIFDERVRGYAERIRNALLQRAVASDLLDVPSGEESKCILQLEHLWKRLLKCGTDRKSIVVAVGGGVVGDLAGFAAATFNRGIRFVQVPTTLLSMVDSSVGGKTGINLPEAKNILGAFWQPSLVWANVEALQTLPTREFRSGLAEVVKYGVILDDAFFAYLESHAQDILARNPEAVSEIIKRSCELKADVVSQDEYETTGLRAVLNYGHTFGHALEALTEYGTLLHGEAISIGMTMAGTLARDLGRWSPAVLERQSSLLRQLGLPLCLNDLPLQPLEASQVIDAMMHDKKNAYGKLHLILPTRLGHVETVTGVPMESIRKAIEAVDRL